MGTVGRIDAAPLNVNVDWVKDIAIMMKIAMVNSLVRIHLVLATYGKKAITMLIVASIRNDLRLEKEHLVSYSLKGLGLP